VWQVLHIVFLLALIMSAQHMVRFVIDLWTQGAFPCTLKAHSLILLTASSQFVAIPFISNLANSYGYCWIILSIILFPRFFLHFSPRKSILYRSHCPPIIIERDPQFTRARRGLEGGCFSLANWWVMKFLKTFGLFLEWTCNPPPPPKKKQKTRKLIFERIVYK
jgi:hypothetical protein